MHNLPEWLIQGERKDAKDCDHNLVQKLFVERRKMTKTKKPKETKLQKKNKKMKNTTKTDKKHKKNKKRTKRSSKAAKIDFSCKEDVSEKILKILKVKRSTYGRKKPTSTKDMSTTQAPRGRDAQATPSFLRRRTKRLQKRKSVKTKRAVRKRREARNVVGSLMDTLLSKVMRQVEDKLKEANKVVELFLEVMLGSQGDDMIPER